MILSDRTIREELAAGRIVIDPFDPACVQPSSVDLHVDAEFRVFRNNRYPFIDVKQEQDLTELVEVEARRAVHPASRASSCWAPRWSASRSPTTSSRGSRASPRSAGSAC